jgi:formiminoglutamate deiminase
VHPPRAKALHFHSLLLPQGWASDVRLSIEAGAIAGIDCGVAPQSGDECADVGLPGLSNLHSHAFQRGMAGLTQHRGTEQDSFWSWRDLLYRFLERLTPDDVEAISAQAYVEMLEAGFTRVGEFHYLHHAVDGRPYADPAEMCQRIATAAERTGIALTLLPVFYAHSGFGGAPPLPSQRRFVQHSDDYARLLERARSVIAPLPDASLGIAPHSLRAVTPDELTRLVELAGESPIHIHAAEQTREVEECRAWSGRRPVEWLLDTQPIDRRWCLVHATHMTPDETRRLAQSGAIAGLCPITEADLGDGAFPAVEFIGAGGGWGIGTDSNCAIAANDELRWLEYGQRSQRHARNLLSGPQRHTGRVLFDHALRGGAQALAVPAGVQLGAPADLISLDLQRPSFAGRSGDALLDSWIFAAGPGGIDAVWRNGTRVVSQGQHRERGTIAAGYRRVLERLLGR